MPKAIFFDRDGVLNVDKNYALSINDIEFYPQVSDVIAFCRSKDYKIFIVTNQPIIARGLITEEELNILHKDYQDILLSKNANALIDKIFYCPHHPNATLENYRKDCNCRKPNAGMILQAAKEFNIDLKESFMIGDRPSDIIAGSLAGTKTIQCLTGKHNDPMIITNMPFTQDIRTLNPDYKVDNVIEIMDII